MLLLSATVAFCRNCLLRASRVSETASSPGNTHLDQSDGLDSLSCEFRHKEQHGRLFLYRHAARQALEQDAFLRMLSAAKSHLSHSPILSAYDQDRSAGTLILVRDGGRPVYFHSKG